MSTPTDDCGCCEGQSTATPQGKAQRSGLAAIAYRAGTHASFKSSLLARLSSTDFPALAGLGTRADDDWTIALLDAFATMGDVLTFYQERIANEAFLPTARERRSVLELARLVGYRPAPGVAAGTALAFELDRPLSPAAVGPAAPLAVTIPLGTRVQSVPAEGELPQTFETTEAIEARIEWNALRAQTAVPVAPHSGQTTLWVQGIGNNLAPGDLLLLVAAARETTSTSTLWQLRTIDSVAADALRGVTELRWSTGLTQFAAAGATPSQGIRAYVLRQRAALFGHNAPDPNLVIPASMPEAQRDSMVTGSPNVLSWRDFALAANTTTIDLDAVYPKIVPGSWFVAATTSTLTLCRIATATTVSESKFAIAGKFSRLTVDLGLVAGYTRPNTAVHAQSEELTLAERPLRQPLFGSTLVLAEVQPLLALGQQLALRGQRQRVRVAANPAGVSFPDEATRQPLPGESFIVAGEPLQRSGSDLLAIAPELLEPGSGSSVPLRWTLIDHDGSLINVDANNGVLRLEPAHDDDAFVEELVRIGTVAGAVVHGSANTTLQLQSPLRQVYDRFTLRLNANVAAATHGESVSEIAGSGDAATASQRFRLRQAPLTHVSAANESGRASTLTVRVDGVSWDEVPSLFEQAPGARVYALRQDDQGRTTVQFGDGVEGARLPSGTDNLRLSYRRDLGNAGNVRAGTLTTLLTRPLGVKAAHNPEAAAGGEDAESLEDARRNAPLSVLTMGRAVSLTDYADFSRAFAGIAKARADWFNGRGERGVLVTVAGLDGAKVASGTALHQNLLNALRANGDALLPLQLVSHLNRRFELTARLTIDPAYELDPVVSAVDAELRVAFAFDARDFGQPVTIDEVIAVAHRVPGVLAVDIDRLRRTGALIGAPEVEARLFPYPASLTAGFARGAEILTLESRGPVLSGRHASTGASA